MITDAQNLFSDSQAITAAAASTNVIDTGPLAIGNTGRNLGYGQDLFIFVFCEVGMSDAGNDSTLTITLQTDDNSGFSSPTTVATLGTLPALTPAGTKFFFPMPIASDAVPYERYIRLLYTPNNGNLSTGTFSAGIVMNVDAYVSTAAGATTGV
jgi:hypothetical protein